MMSWERLQSWCERTHWAVLLPVSLVVALVFPAVTGSSGENFLTSSARATAIVLLVGVIGAAVETAHRWRIFTLHDSIRADITAAGGLGKRLMV